MLKEIQLSNFKAIGQSAQTIPIKPLMLLYGPNSAGKSSIMQALLWFSDIMMTSNKDCLQPSSAAGQHGLGDFTKYKNKKAPKKIWDEKIWQYSEQDWQQRVFQRAYTIHNPESPITFCFHLDSISTPELNLEFKNPIAEFRYNTVPNQPFGNLASKIRTLLEDSLINNSDLLKSMGFVDEPKKGLIYRYENLKSREAKKHIRSLLQKSLSSLWRHHPSPKIAEWLFWFGHCQRTDIEINHEVFTRKSYPNIHDADEAHNDDKSPESWEYDNGTTYVRAYDYDMTGVTSDPALETDFWFKKIVSYENNRRNKEVDEWDEWRRREKSIPDDIAREIDPETGDVLDDMWEDAIKRTYVCRKMIPGEYSRKGDKSTCAKIYYIDEPSWLSDSVEDHALHFQLLTETRVTDGGISIIRFIEMLARIIGARFSEVKLWWTHLTNLKPRLVFFQIRDKNEPVLTIAEDHITGEFKLDHHLPAHVISGFNSIKPNQLIIHYDRSWRPLSGKINTDQLVNPKDAFILSASVGKLIDNIIEPIDSFFRKIEHIPEHRWYPAQGGLRPTNIADSKIWDMVHSAGEDQFGAFQKWMTVFNKSAIRLERSHYYFDIIDAEYFTFNHDCTHRISGPAFIYALDPTSNSILDFDDLGNGIRQTFSIIAQSLILKNASLLIQEPETNLHPRVHCELADLFIESTRDNKNFFLIETHSEHLILRLLRRIRETTEGELPDGKYALTPDQICVLYVEPGEQGSKILELPVTPDGDFRVPWPGGFFAERATEIFGPSSKEMTS